MSECLILSDGLSSGHQAIRHQTISSATIQVVYYSGPHTSSTSSNQLSYVQYISIFRDTESQIYGCIRNSVSDILLQQPFSNAVVAIIWHSKLLVFQPLSYYYTQMISNRISADQIQSVKQYQPSSCFQTFSKSVGYLMKATRPLMWLTSTFVDGCDNNLDELASRCSCPLRNCPQGLQMARATPQKTRVPTRTTVDQVQVETTVAMKKAIFSMTTARGTSHDSKPRARSFISASLLSQTRCWKYTHNMERATRNVSMQHINDLE